jgi:hypothetical protein
MSGERGSREGRRAPPDGRATAAPGDARRAARGGGVEKRMNGKLGSGGLRRTGGVLCKTDRDRGLFSVFIKGFFARY